MKVDLPLMKNVLQTLGKSVLISLGLTAAALTKNAGIHNNILGLGTSYGPRAIGLRHLMDLAQQTTTLINEEVEDMKIY